MINSSNATIERKIIMTKCQYCGSTIKNNKPASAVIAKFGGVKRMSELTGIRLNTIYRWTYPKDKNNGTNGVIPIKNHPVILKAAKKHGVDVCESDLV